MAVLATSLLLQEGYAVAFVTPSAGTPNDTALGNWATDHGVPVKNLGSLDELGGKFDLGISTYYDRIFRQRHIDAFGMLLNVHNSLLPRNRGVRPVNWALRNGDSEHGVSLHAITPGIDEGPVLDHQAFPIDSALDEVRDVYERCLVAAEILLTRSIPRVWDLTPRPQDEAHATYHDSSQDDQLDDRRFWTRDSTSL